MVRWKKELDKELITLDENNRYISQPSRIGISTQTLHSVKLTDLTLSSIIELTNDPSLVIEKPEQWCPICHNAKTKIPSGDLTKAYNKPYVKLIKDFIIQNNMYKFTKDELIDNMQIRLYTDGTLQMTGLGILVLNGFLTRINEKYTTKDKKGNSIEHIRSVFIRNEIIKMPNCVINNKHIFKDKWEETKIFGLHG